MKKNLEINELNKKEAIRINGGGPAWEWIGKILGRFNKVMTNAVENGYQYAGLFH